jgi:phosphoglycolate phosphatase-like HAD superfamily hydrolase
VFSFRCLLIDFDGPICSMFAGRPAPGIAEQLNALLRRGLDREPPFELTTDPIRTLVQAAELGDEALARSVADALRDAEVQAVETATPTPGAEDVLRAARETGRRVAVVSNNASDAIEAYLQRTGLLRYVDGLAGRFDGMAPALLKPDPLLVRAGLAGVQAVRDDAVFLGDSVTDIEAGKRAGVRTIGYANRPGKSAILAGAGADLVIDSMREFAGALRADGH